MLTPEQIAAIEASQASAVFTPQQAQMIAQLSIMIEKYIPMVNAIPFIPPGIKADLGKIGKGIIIFLKQGLIYENGLNELGMAAGLSDRIVLGDGGDVAKYVARIKAKIK